MKASESTWTTDWPWLGLNVAEVDREIGKITNLSSPYTGEQRAMCFPGTPLDSMIGDSGHVVNAMAGRLLNMHLNNIGTHTLENSAEAGFDGPQAIENAVVRMVAGILGAKEIDGHFCSGGTDANIEGMWIGREYLRKGSPKGSGSPKIAVLVTRMVHYSVLKGARILSLGNIGMKKCGHCGAEHIAHPEENVFGSVQFVGMNENGEMDPGLLEEKISELKREGVSKFLIVLTAGTTALGSIDPIRKIAKVASANLDKDSFYIHVDAAFGGFTVPFLGGPSIGFDIPEVQSMTVDAHKMGHLPYPGGIFLCRKGLQEHICEKVEYVSGHRDDTLVGSRPFFQVAIGYVLFRQMGISGHTKYVRACVDARDRLVRELARIANPKIHVVHASPYVNQLALEIIGEKDRTLDRITKDNLIRRYFLRTDFFPGEPSDSNSCPRTVFKICVMPHTFDYLDRFAEDLSSVVGGFA